MKRTSMMLIAAMGTTAVLAGCGDDEKSGGGEEQGASDPKASVMQALDASAEAKDMTTTMSLDTDAETLNGLMEASDSSSGSGAAQDTQSQEKAVELLPKSKVTVTQHSRDKALGEEKDAKDLDSTVSFQIGEGTVEVRQVEGGLYFRADVDKIGQETGLFTADQLRSGLSGSGASSDDPSMEFLEKALEGEWVGVSPEKMEEFAKEQGVDLDSLMTQSTGTDLSAEKQAELQKDLKGFMDEHGEFTEAGDHVRVALPIEESWDDFATIVNKYQADGSEEMPKLDADAKKAIKDDAKGYIDLEVDGEELKGMNLDFTQVTDWVDVEEMDASKKQEFEDFKEQVSDGPLSLTVDYTDGEAPAKPDQFTEVPQELLDGGAAGAGGSGSLPSSASAY
ncbi:hypothetical protein [Kytococcus sp. Marseille-QA3725]